MRAMINTKLNKTFKRHNVLQRHVRFEAKPYLLARNTHNDGAHKAGDWMDVPPSMTSAKSAYNLHLVLQNITLRT